MKLSTAVLQASWSSALQHCEIPLATEWKHAHTPEKCCYLNLPSWCAGLGRKNNKNFSKFASKSRIFIVTYQSQQWLHCIQHTFWHMWRTSECRDFITTAPVSSVVTKLHTHWHVWMQLSVGTILIAMALVHNESLKKTNVLVIFTLYRQWSDKHQILCCILW